MLRWNALCTPGMGVNLWCVSPLNVNLNADRPFYGCGDGSTRSDGNASVRPQKPFFLRTSVLNCGPRVDANRNCIRVDSETAPRPFASNSTFAYRREVNAAGFRLADCHLALYTPPIQ